MVLLFHPPPTDQSVGDELHCFGVHTIGYIICVHLMWESEFLISTYQPYLNYLVKQHQLSNGPCTNFVGGGCWAYDVIYCMLIKLKWRLGTYDNTYRHFVLPTFLWLGQKVCCPSHPSSCFAGPWSYVDGSICVPLCFLWSGLQGSSEIF